MQIKQALPCMMNGPVSASMRQKGLSYRVIYGVELPRLQEYATTLPHTFAVAAALWHEDIRECRLLAGMLMPPHDFPEDMAEEWLSSMRYAEEVDTTILHLLQHQPYAGSKVFEWISAEAPLHRYAGYQLLSRLFMRGMRLTTRDAQQFLDHLNADIHDTTQPLVARAAYKTLLRYMEQGIPEERMGQKVLDGLS